MIYYLTRIIATACLTIFLTASAAADTVNRDIARFLTTIAANGDLNGSVLIAEKGRVIYQGSFGYSDFPTHRRAAVSDVYPIASITKTITSTAVLQLVAKGKLKLDDRVAQILPDFPYPEITVRQLLSHTSGIPSYSAYFDDESLAGLSPPLRSADLVPAMRRTVKPVLTKAGERWRYDNLNYALLAIIIERVSGEAYYDYVKRHILDVAGMTETRPFHNLFDATQNKVKGLVIPHLYAPMYADEPIRADSITYISQYWSRYQFSGFGEYVSTVRDLLRYDQALYDGKLVEDTLLKEAFSVVKLTNGQPNPGDYGLGWNVWNDPAMGKFVYHAGGTIGLNCVLFRNISKRQTAIVFNVARSNANYIAMNVLRILNKIEPEVPRKDLVRIYAKLLTTKGKEDAARTTMPLAADVKNFRFTKEGLIQLGYSFVGEPNPYRLNVTDDHDKALAVFEFAIRMFPDYWNSYDSYADILARTGKKGLAIEMYKRSIELNPENQGGITALRKLQGATAN